MTVLVVSDPQFGFIGSETAPAVSAVDFTRDAGVMEFLAQLLHLVFIRREKQHFHISACG